jgi:signal transduction histidine kinase
MPKNDVKIICDSEQTAVVFENLITNAIQAIGEEKGEISIRFIENDASISIEVEDSGKGINDEDMPKIFEPLFTTKQSGTGLGLASCKKIIAMHNGTINVKNNPTVFSVILPKKVLVQSRQSYDANK